MNINKRKKLAAGLSIFSNILLTTLKITAGIISGSISIISEAIHSLSDFFASVLTYFSVTKSSIPADYDHPYGHGKYEDMSGFIEGILIIFAAFFIIYESAKKIIFGLNMDAQNNLGITVMFAAVIMNIVVSSILFKTAKDSNSISLYADGEHLRTDVYSSLGVFLGLLIIKFTGYTLIDPIIAILVSVFIYRTGYTISKKAFQNLLDHSLPQKDIEEIKSIVKAFSGEARLKKNSIKTRQTGPSQDLDMVLLFPKDTTLCDCHKICDEIEKQIQKLYPKCSISIHAEPLCYKKNCQKTCDS